MTIVPDASFWLVTLLAKSTALLAVATVLHAMLRHRASAATRHWIWTLAVCGLLALPVLSMSLPSWRVEVPVNTGPPVDDRTIALPSAPALESATTAPVAAFTAGADASPPLPSTPAAASTVQRIGASALPAALAIYLTGVALLVARLIVQHRAARRLLARAVPVESGAWRRLLDQSALRLRLSGPVRLRQSSAPVMPMATGVVRPTILLPESADSWSDDRRQAVLLHELAHISRHDCLTQLLASLACAIYWPHPAVWWVARRLRVERELACDDRVISAGAEPRDYAGHLLDIAYTLGSGRAPALAVSMARRGQLEGRMLAVLDSARNRRIPGRGARLTATAAALALVLPLAVVAASAVPMTYDDGLLSMTGGIAPTPPAVPTPAVTIEKGAEKREDKAEEKRNDKDAGTVGEPPNDKQEQAAASGTGSWVLRPSNKPGSVYLEMREDHSNSGTTVPVSALEGLATSQMSGTGGPVRFSVRRDAGTFTFDGHVRSGVGGGTYSFAPSQAFAGELAKRGIDRPSDKEQYEMAKHDVGLALVDELATQGYPKPTAALLVRAGHHGVRVDFVRDMGQLGYKVGSLEALIKMRDHGVGPEYVREMTAQGLPKLTADQLVNARDHGVTPEFVRELTALGYGSMPIEGLIRVRDHGVTPEFVKALKAAGYDKLSMEQLVKTRDHGVSPDFIQGMSTLGYTKLPIEELITTRDHGVTPEYIKELAALGHAKLSLADIVRARDHGVSGDYASQMKALGYGLPIDELIRARDHGVTPDYVRGLKSLGYDGLSIDQVIKLRDHGVTPERIKRANERAGTKLPLDMIQQMANGGGLR